MTHFRHYPVVHVGYGSKDGTQRFNAIQIVIAHQWYSEYIVLKLKNQTLYEHMKPKHVSLYDVQSRSKSTITC